MSVLSRHSWPILAAMVLTATIVFVLSTTLTTFASGGVILKLSHDPYTNSTSQHQTQVEPDSYSNGSTIVAGTQAGRFFDGGASNVGWATSTNNGSTWKHGFLPGTTVYATPKGRYARVSDPAVAYDAAHNTWMISTLAISTASGSPVGAGVLVSRSTDGGLTWTNPVTVAKTSTAFFDKDWIVCDDTSTSPFYGHCYVEWDTASNGDLIQMSTSSDGGSTWGVAKATANHASGLGGQPLVQPNGTVIVPYLGNSISAFTSTNGGSSWTSSVTVGAIDDHPVAGNMRSEALPSAEIDRAGKAYVVWQSCAFESGCKANDIVLSTSTNGTTWSAVQRIPIDPVNSGVDHFTPGIAVDKSTSGSSAHIGLGFYYFPVANCSTSTCQLDFGFVSSTDGGAHWSAKTQLAGPMKTTWLANTNQGHMVGDYVSTSIVGGKAFPLFEVATAPSGSKFNEALYTATGGLDIVAGKNAASSADVVFTQARAVVPGSAY
jgi:BNR repeat-like domain